MRQSGDLSIRFGDLVTGGLLGVLDAQPQHLPEPVADLFVLDADAVETGYHLRFEVGPGHTVPGVALGLGLSGVIRKGLRDLRRP